MKRLWILFFLPITLFAEPITTRVAAKNGLYDGEKVILTGEVRIENALGVVTADEASLTKSEKGPSEMDFASFELKGKVDVVLESGGRFKCDRVAGDCERLVSHFYGEEQIIYTDARGEIVAREAVVEYVKREGRIQIAKIILLHDVRMVSADREACQYALADRVEYFPQEERILFMGEGKHVLFFDKKKGIELSAEQVRAERVGEREVVQGIGDVSFVFKEEELKSIQERFGIK